MNRRDFVTGIAGATAAASVLNLKTALGAGSSTTAPFYVKGLVMVSFEDPQVLRLGFPNAPGHRGTLSVIPQSGSQHNLNIRGKVSVEGTAVGSSQPGRFEVPELVKMSEFYGNALHSRIAESPTVISIPYTTIKSISAAELSPTPYTFLRRDTGEEVASFRVRKIAESLRIDLASDGILHMDGGKTSVALKSVRELHAEYAPENPSANSNADAFAAHFGHYLAYLDRPANARFDVVPQRVGEVRPSVPKVGNSFAVFPPFTFCFMVEV